MKKFSRVEDRVKSANRRARLLVLFAGLANLREIVHRSDHGTTEPDSESLHQVLTNFAAHLIVESSFRVLDGHAVIKEVLKISLETLVETSE